MEEKRKSNGKKIEIKKTISKFFSNLNKKFNLEKNKFNAIELLIVITMASIFGIFVGEIIFYNKDGNVKINSNKISEIEKVYRTLLSDYNGNVDEKDLEEAAIKGMMGLLGDNYSFYMDDEESSEFNEKLDGKFYGLGIEIVLGDNNIPTVKSIYKGSSAEKYELKEADQIIKVNDVDVSKKSLDELSSMIKGTTTKKLKITIRRDNKEIEKEVETSLAEIPSVTSKIYEENGKKIGYVYLSIFASNTDEQLKEHLEALEKEQIESLIIDVRSNSGGHLDTATNILEMFLNKGQVMYQIKSKDNVKKYTSTKEVNRNLKLVVLIDSASASASEVLASALQEQKNATLVGTTTYGKGSVQKTMQLSNGSMIKYTSETWLTSKGESIDKKGIKPQVEVVLTDKYQGDEKDDNQLQKALEILREN